MERRLNETEIACIKRLAELYEQGEFYNGGMAQDKPALALGLSEDNWVGVMRMMEACGAIEETTHASTGMFLHFRISPTAVQLARAIREKEQEKKEPRNIVEEIRETAQSSRVVAWGIIVFFILVALVTFANQLLQLINQFKSESSGRSNGRDWRRRPEALDTSAFSPGSRKRAA